ncbi:hypothetical protein Tco_0602573 [Tanacetum coccineum]
MKLVELVNQKKKFFAQQRAEAKRNKPMTPAQQKDYMSNYIKNQEGGYSIKQLKSLSMSRAGQEVLEKPVKRQKIGEASVEELVIQPLQVRYPIIDWDVYSEDTRRGDLVKLWDLVKERFSTTEPTDDKEKELYMHDPLVWRLYDTCGVHHLSSVRGHDIFMLVEKEYPLTRGTLGLMMVVGMIIGRQVNRVHVLDFKGLTDEMRQALTDRLRMVYTGAEG